MQLIVERLTATQQGLLCNILHTGLKSKQVENSSVVKSR